MGSYMPLGRPLNAADTNGGARLGSALAVAIGAQVGVDQHLDLLDTPRLRKHYVPNRV